MSRWQPSGPVGRFVHNLEENMIALILALMTVITFVNVVLRYGFNSAIIWGQEVVLILFAWLVMFGVSYGVKVTAHLGVDAITNMFKAGPRKIMAVLSLVACILYAFLLMKGAWDHYANYINLPGTTGRWLPTGFEEMRMQDYRGYAPTIQVPIPEWSRGFLESWLLIEGDEPYEKLPLAIPYIVIPLGAALLLFRFIQAGIGILRGTRSSLIVSHEAEEAVEQVRLNEREE